MRCIAAGIVLTVGLGLAGCMTDRDGTSAVALAAVPTGDSALRDYTASWGKRYDQDPADRAAAINYARGLRGLTQYSQAAAVLQSAAVKHPYDKTVLGAYGKALIDAGRLNEAADVLAKAHTPERPDWSILSAQGTVADQLGDHAGALSYYQAALKIAPDEPTVLSNLGLSYALDKHLPEAEQALRRAAASPRADARVRQNLALVLGLEGKFVEAEALARHDLSPADAAESIAAVRDSLADADSWSAMRPAARRKGSTAPR